MRLLDSLPIFVMPIALKKNEKESLVYFWNRRVLQKNDLRSRSKNAPQTIVLFPWYHLLSQMGIEL